MKLSDDARQVIHDWRWGPYIHEPIERQERDDAVIKIVMNTFDKLEAENEALRDALLDIVWDADGIPIEYPTQARVYALLTGGESAD